jgi:hypothetical protein
VVVARIRTGDLRRSGCGAAALTSGRPLPPLTFEGTASPALLIQAWLIQALTIPILCHAVAHVARERRPAGRRSPRAGRAGQDTAAGEQGRPGRDADGGRCPAPGGTRTGCPAPGYAGLDGAGSDRAGLDWAGLSWAGSGWAGAE